MGNMAARRETAATGNESFKPATAELAITRVLDAPRALVFKAWTEPARLVQWFGPQGFSIPACEMDVRPAGAWRLCMRSPTGVDHWVAGVYREIVPPERLVFTWVRQDAEGKLGAETVVTVTLVAEGAKTKLTLHHALFESVAARDDHRGGWTSCLDRLPGYLATA